MIGLNISLSLEDERILTLLAQNNRSKKRKKKVTISSWYQYTNKGIYCFICNSSIKMTFRLNVKEHALEHLNKYRAFI